ncbi:MAG: YihA family ribosome biogenesis GTP-binding protein [Saprospiraceae bacterium]|uniref:ribosome biogenesis GTP-binding protein YihA/YsxC n=1 Tax=Candidatus Brachybacter algidus TaxID=2982024 RepID=UPI001D364C2A|nr:ribosome biogenesis GTP-binding protein YihA/YsxC [Candidatus Brachybacter algidus]HQW70284.1 ribosome biogenesis GTP-binding protein YihA/YsxC [Saprospiraceae bacterium]MBK6374255.1 YihA family ribosome biogenesis GTP-binding protein [Candidatus Brachybacter algidus]MBK6449938.1 YihA family ribosome biogenesis GTP-binding protein [Candidatus Brachybacter algidus]MBK7604183.1 YihA family ribosome biogenesis GTP-binding protein [Candidatus Brachybacter algidus]MBK8748128.1 YihA family riboso
MSTQLNIKFIGSFTALSQVPKSEFPEFAFIGRSNVGKSSLINMLSGKTHIAKVSNTPGKTQHINLFDIDGQWNIVDLPGYGYAKSSKANRATWSKMVTSYLTGRDNLSILFVLLDSRLPAQKIDMEFMAFCGQKNIPFVIIYTKADKSSFNQLNKQLAEIQKVLLLSWNTLPEQFITSSSNKTGRDEILDYIDSINEQHRAK